jgi:hypothetical protein
MLNRYIWDDLKSESFIPDGVEKMEEGSSFR